MEEWISNIREIFPKISVSLISADLAVTQNPNQTIDRILTGRLVIIF